MLIEAAKTELVLDNKVLVTNLIVANKFLSRMVGLLGRKGLPDGSAMLLKPCSSIHTIGMQFALDVIFIDRNMSVVRTLRNLRPNRFALGGHGAYSAIEMETGWFDMSQVKVGQKFTIRR